MNAKEIEIVMSRVKWNSFKFLGVFASDELPLPQVYPCCFIANVDRSDQPGSHWVAFVFPRHGVLEYFCPLGISFYHWPIFTRYIRDQVGVYTITFNLFQVQSENSSTCGQLCIEFLVKRDKGKSFVNIVNNFSRQKFSNDISAMQFVRQLLG